MNNCINGNVPHIFRWFKASLCRLFFDDKIFRPGKSDAGPDFFSDRFSRSTRLFSVHFHWFHCGSSCVFVLVFPYATNGSIGRALLSGYCCPTTTPLALKLRKSGLLWA